MNESTSGDEVVGLVTDADDLEPPDPVGSVQFTVWSSSEVQVTVVYPDGAACSRTYSIAMRAVSSAMASLGRLLEVSNDDV